MAKEHKNWYFVTSQDSPTDDRVENTLSSMDKTFTKEEYLDYSIYVVELTIKEIALLKSGTLDMASISSTNPFKI